MNRHSIFFKLNILFTLAVLAAIVAGLAIRSHLMVRERAELLLKSRLLLQEMRRSRSIPPTLIETLDLVPVTGAEREKILHRAKRLPRRLPLYRRRKSSFRRIVFRNGEHYLYLKPGRSDASAVILKPRNGPWKRQAILWMIFGGFVALLTLIYLTLRRALSPIRKLENDIRRYGEGTLSFRDLPRPAGEDEISRLAKAFYDSADKIERLGRSRQLFLRNLLHELNTPLTKGKLLAEISREPRTREMLHSVFDRLSLILEELVQIERISASKSDLRRHPVRIVDLIDQARDRLYLEESFPVDVGNATLSADFSSMSIVFKNLIGNAVKHGKNPLIRLREGKVEFVSDGPRLEHPLEWYTEPFRQGEKSAGGYGLGLYIVREILERHGMKLEYRHENGKNIFVIVTGASFRPSQKSA